MLEYTDFFKPFEVFQFCPKCGVKSFSKGDDNSLNCSSCDFVYYINPPIAVIALIENEEGKLLFTQRKFEPNKNKYDFPGGFVDIGENLEKALIREIKEELGLEIKDYQYMESVVTDYPYKEIMYHPVDAVFKCSVLDWKKLHVQDDVKSIQFFNLHEICDEDLAFESHRLLIKRLKSMKTDY